MSEKRVSKSGFVWRTMPGAWRLHLVKWRAGWLPEEMKLGYGVLETNTDT
jgi:hypothetical protein